jgi:hypothetical protein
MCVRRTELTKHKNKKKAMEVRVKLTSGHVMTINIAPGSTVLELKQSIHLLLPDCPIDTHFLSYTGAKLENDTIVNATWSSALFELVIRKPRVRLALFHAFSLFRFNEPDCANARLDGISD